MKKGLDKKICNKNFIRIYPRKYLQINLIIFISLILILISMALISGGEGSFTLEIIKNISEPIFENETIKINWSVLENGFDETWVNFSISDPESNLIYTSGNSSGAIIIGSEEITISHVGVYEISIEAIGKWNNSNFTETLEDDFEVLQSENGGDENGNGNSTNNNSGEESEIVIELISPNHNSDLEDSKINFSFFAESGIGISKCIIEILKLENINGTTASTSTLFKKETLNNINSGSTNSKEIVGFTKGTYSWDVTCSNSLKEKNSNTRIFYMNKDQIGSTQSKNDSYEKEEELEEILIVINNFLEKESGFDLETREVIRELKILEDLNAHKRKLLQMRIDLKNNFTYIISEDRKKERRIEIEEFLEFLSKNVPISIEITKREEYTKNTLNHEVSEIVRDYIKHKNMILNSRRINDLIRKNKELQNSVSILTKFRLVELEYFNENKEKFSLIIKEVIIKEDLEEYYVIEKFPKNIELNEKISIKNNHDILTENSLFLIKGSDLNDKKLIYTIKDFENLEEIKKTDTIILTEKVTQISSRNVITGFFSFIENAGDVGGDGFWFYFRWFLFAVFLFGISIFGYNEIKYSMTPNTKEIRKINGLVKDAYNSVDLCESLKDEEIRKKEMMRAKRNYYLAKRLYPLLSSELKDYAYDKILRLRRFIDEKEIFRLVKECIEDLRDGKKKEAILKYIRIKELYPKISIETREGVFSKIESYLDFFEEDVD